MASNAGRHYMENNEQCTMHQPTLKCNGKHLNSDSGTFLFRCSSNTTQEILFSCRNNYNWSNRFGSVTSARIRFRILIKIEQTHRLYVSLETFDNQIDLQHMLHLG